MLPPRSPLADNRLFSLLQPAAVFSIALSLLLLTRHLVLRSIRRTARPRSFASVFAETIRFPSLLWSLAAALAVALEYADLTARLELWTTRAISAFVIISVTSVAVSIAVRMLTVYADRQGVPFAAAGLSRALIRISIFMLGALWLLANFKVEITPLLTFLGVGGIAVGLALQDTLANLFAGIHILIERPITVGDFVRLESGQEGTVSDIGWRTTRVRTGGNDTVVLPNTKITTGVVVNYSLPEPRTIAAIPIAVAHDADAEQVCRAAVDEALRVDGVLSDPAPVCLCDPGVLPTHLEFKLYVNVAARQQQGRVASDIRVRLLRRFRAENIPLPKAELAHAHWR